jgi:septal ring-binding cell division protein DamX
MNRTSLWRIIQNSTWLLGGLIMLCAAFLLWIGIQVHEHMTLVETPLEQPDLPVEPEKVRFSPTLGMMTDMVPELNTKKDISSVEEHEAEFKGADFIKENSARWTLQLMSVTQEEVIRNYLLKRTDRDKFYYFRYVEEGKPQRYVLTYGIFNSVSNAMSAMGSTGFGLPDSVKAFPERFSTYKPYVIDTNSDQEITNLTRQGRVYAVRLRSVLVPVERPPAVGMENEPVINSQVGASAKPGTVATAAPTATTTPAGTGNTTGGNPPVVPPVQEAPIQDPFN